MKNETLLIACENLRKALQVCKLCLIECEKGSLLARNPYIRSSKVKKNLVALHESIQTLTQCIMIFCGEYAKSNVDTKRIKTYYTTYAFLYDFNDEIKREEYDHLIILKDKDMMAKFNKLQYQSEYLLYEVTHSMKEE